MIVMATKTLKRKEVALGFINIPAKNRAELIGNTPIPFNTKLNEEPAKIDKYGRLWSEYLKNRYPINTEVTIERNEDGFLVTMKVQKQDEDITDLDKMPIAENAKKTEPAPELIPSEKRTYVNALVSGSRTNTQELAEQISEVHWYFKLFNSIKEEHEVDFAEIELLSLFGNVRRIKNFSDILDDPYFSQFKGEKTRVQDFLAHELPYGDCHGFLAQTGKVFRISQLVKRLAYSREFFLVVKSENPDALVQEVFPEGVLGKNLQSFQNNGYVLLRVITNQFFLEKSQYISKLSRNEKEASANVEYLFAYLTEKLYRIPATETMQIGKRLEDYFAKREEPSLYLTHYMHPYKGKFHPKMVRALLNYVFPWSNGIVMDNFAGCGTLLVEATLMELDSIGVEINPLSALMSNVKCNSLSIPVGELKKTIEKYLDQLRDSFVSYKSQSAGSLLHFMPDYDKKLVTETRSLVPESVLKHFRDPKVVDYVLIAHQFLKKVEDTKIREFLQLALSGTISDLARRQHGEFLSVFQSRLKNLYLRIYIFSKLNEVLKIHLGTSKTHAADNRNIDMVTDGTINAIVNSPPYSTALDYIKNDYPQLVLLQLANISKLEANMIGNPHFKVYSKTLLQEIKNQEPDYANLPEDAKEALSSLVRCGREKEAMRAYKFFKDMRLVLSEMKRVLKKGSKCAIIIGNNHYKLDDHYAEVKNDEVIEKVGNSFGLVKDRKIVRNLEKTQAGMIRYESILILKRQ